MTPTTAVRVGIVGTGDIAPAYIQTLRHHKSVEVVAVAGRDRERTTRFAREYGLPIATDLQGMLAGREVEVDMVLNLTEPTAHARITEAALMAGNHVYSEKPLALTTADASSLLGIARANGRYLGCAPDTFLSTPFQALRRAIDRGVIGRPVAANAVTVNHGMEHWHPRPEGFYRPGAGPMLDIGPYPLTLLITLFGPVLSVAGASTVGDVERVSAAGPAAGRRIHVSTPTHVAAILRFEEGLLVNLTTGFEAWGSAAPELEVFGTEGALSVDRVGSYRARVRLLRAGSAEWVELPLDDEMLPWEDYGLGIIETAAAIRAERPSRADASLALHALDAMNAILSGGGDPTASHVVSRVDRPQPTTPGWLRQGH